MIAAFSVIDWFVLIIVLISIAFAAMKGFVRELIGLGSILLAFLFAAWFYTSAAAPFKDVVKTENLALFCGFSIVFIGTLILGVVVNWIVSRFIKAARLEWFDRFLGALFGLLRGWILGGIVFVGLTAFGIQSERVRNSELAPYFLPASRVIALVTPAEFRAQFRSGYAAIERWWKEQH
jgi:membrane protein required for colicin V production